MDDGHDVFTLTFPDGEAVGEGELGEWLEMVERDCEDPGAIALARRIVANIRRQSN